MKNQKTFVQRKEDIKRKWHLVDVKDRILGKVATEIASKLIGKQKATYTPHLDGGDYVVLINAAEVKLSRNKADKKVYSWHTGFPGGLKEMLFSKMIVRKPEEVIRRAVINMLPKNRLRKNRMARLKIYPGSEHKHHSQFKN
ncbi:MAG: 50S ribosomal protein L13 [Candidatus Woesebacteria bacterium]|jgi:large subunit ribosomal protein L13